MGYILLTVALLADVGGTFSPAQEARVKSIEDRLAALEAQPRAAQPGPVAALPQSYAAFYRVVAGGASGVLFVGRPVPTGFAEYRVTLSVPTLEGFGPGVYQCDLVGGRLMMVPRAEAGSTPAFATPVRNLIYQFAPRGSCAGGNCPR